MIYLFPSYFFWYCCLHPIEAFVFFNCYSAYTGNNAYIEKTVFDAFWVVIGQPVGEARYDTFVHWYHLTFGLVPIGEDEWLEVYFFDPLFWLGAQGFFLSPLAACEDPCKPLHYSDL